MIAHRFKLNLVILVIISSIHCSVGGDDGERGGLRRHLRREDTLMSMSMKNDASEEQPLQAAENKLVQWFDAPPNSSTNTSLTTPSSPSKAPSQSPTYPNPTSSPTVPLQTFSTTFQSNTTYAGNMFDIVANNDIAIYNIGIHTYVKRIIEVQVYTRVGSYVNVDKDLSQWTHVANTTVRGQGMGGPTLLDNVFNDDPIIIRNGQRRAFYVTTNGPWFRASKVPQGVIEGSELYTNDIKDADFSFFLGTGKRYPIQDGTYRPRLWNGVLQYRTVHFPDPPEPAMDRVTFRRGDLAVTVSDLGIKICLGMSVRMIAKASEAVQYADGTSSKINFHSMADGAAVFPDDNGGYVYVSNSEMKEGLGGVYGLGFDSEGNVVDYKPLLQGTTRNCGGGVAPWGSWLTCEEYGKGQCWQVDPEGKRTAQITQLGGNGGNYESVAVDNTNPHQPIFYVTEDHERGALRKYTPPKSFGANGQMEEASWDSLHSNGGTTEYLLFKNGGRFTWTTNEEQARASQQQFYKNVEGIDYHSGKLYFVSKKLLMLYVLDLGRGTYTQSSTKFGVSTGGGEFRHQPDQLVHNNAGDYLYLTEDGGKTVGVYAIHKPSGQKYAIFEAYEEKYLHDETTGLAFSPDGSKMYAAFQDCGCKESEFGLDYTCGCLLEFSRDDGLSFDGSTLGLKFHSV